MTLRHILAYLVFGVSLALVVYAGASALSQAAGSPQKAVSVEVKQLPLENGIVPIDVRCDNVKVVGNAIERLSCVLKNNSAKAVTAAGVRVTVTLERNGKQYVDSGLLTLDSRWQSPGDKNKISYHPQVNIVSMTRLLITEQPQ